MKLKFYTSTWSIVAKEAPIHEYCISVFQPYPRIGENIKIKDKTYLIRVLTHSEQLDEIKYLIAEI